MGFLSSFFGKKRELSDQMVFELIDKGSKLYFSKIIASNRNGAKFEASLINALFLLKTAKSMAPRHYSLIENKVFSCLRELSDNYKITSQIGMSYSDFINLRFEQYTIELEPVLDSKGKIIASKTYYNLFDRPLQAQSGQLLDPIIHMEFLRVFTSYLRMIEEGIPVLVDLIKTGQ